VGRKVTTTDQRGVIHTYAYDTQGRQLSDAATTIPASVDGIVKRIEWAYDDISRIKTVSSYDATGVYNQVAYTYSGYGQITKSEQSHSGAVVSGTTPAVTYAYADGASGIDARYVRLASVTYPTTSRAMFLRYPASGIGDALNRPYQVAGDAGGATVYGDYTYLGAGSIVKLTQPFASAMTLDFGAGGTYNNLDRFLRPTAHRWTMGATVKAGMDYAYDNSHARTRQKVAWAGAPANFDEAATYDGLDRVKKVNRGALASVTSDIADAASVWQQQWGLDAVGNWRTWTQDADGGVGAGVATVQTRVTNKANEIDVDDDHANAPGASITGTGVTWIAPVYDAGGNMTSAPTVADGTLRQHYLWDAWNRLVSVSADNAGVPGQVLVQYRYDGLGHRVRTTDTKNTAVTTDDVTDDIYYNEANQEIEVRRAGSATACEQYIWDLRYIDTALVRFRSPTNNGTLSETIVPLADANHNVTALVNTSGTVLERYRYCPYGKRIITDAAGTVITASAYDWRIGFTGRRYDVETGLAFYRNRYYHATLGNFISRDPLGYVDGMNFYQYVRGNPWSLLDALGLSAKATRDDLLAKELNFETPESARKILDEMFDKYIEKHNKESYEKITGDDLDAWKWSFEESMLREARGHRGEHDPDGLIMGPDFTDLLMVKQIGKGLWDLGKWGVGKLAAEEVVERGASQAGQTYAKTVTPGGTGRALAGHGELRPGSGDFIIPNGTSLTLWTQEGKGITDGLGKLVEMGDYASIAANPVMASAVTGARTVLPGGRVPNYFLTAPNGLNIMGASRTVEDATPLSNLLGPSMGPWDWAACLKVRQ
jgi:RHS repeat-associated protein